MTARACAITGASGLVGSACARRLASQGVEVRAFGRNASGPSSARFELGRRVDPAAFRGVDALIHCAYDFSARTWAEIEERNVRGSIELLRAAKEAGVENILFVSSVSAFEGCSSMYGKGKLLVEAFARSIGGRVIRPGLVYGAPGGMFGSLEKAASSPVIPVFDGGRQPLVLVHADDLAQAAEALVSGQFDRELLLTAAHPAPLEFREIMRRLATRRGRQPLFVSVPGAAGLAGLRTLEFLGLRPGFRSDSLVGLLNPNPRIEFGLPAGFPASFREFPA